MSLAIDLEEEMNACKRFGFSIHSIKANATTICSGSPGVGHFVDQRAGARTAPAGKADLPLWVRPVAFSHSSQRGGSLARTCPPQGIPTRKGLAGPAGGRRGISKPEPSRPLFSRADTGWAWFQGTALLDAMPPGRSNLFALALLGVL